VKPRTTPASLLAAAALLLVATLGAGPARDGDEIVVYKSPSCGCCEKWIEHLRANGLSVQAHDAVSMNQIKRENGIPPALRSCHTAFVGGYFIEGHVPAEDIRRLLATRPPILGLALPKMPVGSPGMEGPDPEPYVVLAVYPDGHVGAFASHRP
jgi:hypothetical protein